MPDLSALGKMILIMGVGLVIIGGLLSLIGKWPASGTGLGWLGRLPGDFLIKRDNFTFYFPLSTGLLLSVVGSLLLYLFFKR